MRRKTEMSRTPFIVAYQLAIAACLFSFSGCEQAYLDRAMQHNSEIRERFFEIKSDALIDDIVGDEINVVCIFLPNSTVRDLPNDIEIGIKNIGVWEPIWDESWTLVFKTDKKYDYVVFDQLKGPLILDLMKYTTPKTPCFEGPVRILPKLLNASSKNVQSVEFYTVKTGEQK